MLDEVKIKRLAEIFGQTKIVIRQLFTKNDDEIIISFDDAVDYLNAKVADDQDFNIDFTKCISLIETSRQWQKIFPLLSRLAKKCDRDELVDNVLISKWAVMAKREISETTKIIDKITIYHQSPERLQDNIKEDIKQQAEDFINKSLDWQEIGSFIKELNYCDSVFNKDLILQAKQRLNDVLKEAIPNIKDEQELWQLRNHLCLPLDLQYQIIQRLYEIME